MGKVKMLHGYEKKKLKNMFGCFDTIVMHDLQMNRHITIE